MKKQATKRLSSFQTNHSTTCCRQACLKSISLALFFSISIAIFAQKPAPPINEGLFKINIVVFGKKMSGLMVIKKVDSFTHRMVMLNETGFQYFDLAIRNDGSEVVSCITPLQKKDFIKLIKNDLQYLVNTNNAYKIAVINRPHNIVKWSIWPQNRKSLCYKIDYDSTSQIAEISIKHIALPLRFTITSLQTSISDAP